MSSRPLTARQSEILKLIATLTAERGYPPTVRELGEALGIRSTNGVVDHLKALETKGFITREGLVSRSVQLTYAGHQAANPGKRRARAPAPESIPVDIPFFGAVAAGAPILAGDRADESIRLDHTLLRNTQDVFALRVKGDSMTGDGLLDGDVVFVRSQPTAPRGAMVVAVIEGEATVKRFYPEKDRIRLEPSNPDYRPILLEASSGRAPSIAGVVVGVFRRV